MNKNDHIMEKFTVSIAGLKILIKFMPISEHVAVKSQLRHAVYEHFRPFITESTDKTLADITVKDQDIYNILFKDDYSFAELAHHTSPFKVTTKYQISFSQFMIILAGVITDLLSSHKGLMLHGSACLINNKACLFLGKEGAGKSTIINMLKARYRVLTDDQIFIRKVDKKHFFYQNPYLEKVDSIIKNPQAYEIGNIYILKKSPHIKARRLTASDSIFYLLKNMLLTEKGKNDFAKTLFDFNSTIHNCSELSFNLDTTQILNFFKNEYAK